MKMLLGTNRLGTKRPWVRNVPMHRAEYLLGVQCFRFHSRMKSTFHGFRSCITIEGNLMDGNPLYLVFRVATAERNTPLHHVSFLCKRKTLRHREIRENGSPVLTSQPTIPRLPPCAVLYRTGSEISRI